MLLEQTPYNKNLPFRIEIINIVEENTHYHIENELEIILVLQGTCEIKNHHLSYSLKTGDLYIIDTEDLHQIYNSSDNILILSLHIDLDFFIDSFPYIDYAIFVCEFSSHNFISKTYSLKNKTDLLKHHIVKLFFSFNALDDQKGNTITNSSLISQVHQLIYILTSYFQAFTVEDNQFKLDEQQTNPIDSERIYRITKHIYLNYSQKVTLEDLAQLEHLSTYYISHFVKKITGLTFQDFLNYVRVENAEKLLLESSFTLTQIGSLSGFSTLNYFNKCFYKWHGISPSDFRKKFIAKTRHSFPPFDQEEAKKLLLSYLNTYEYKPTVETQQVKPFDVHVSIDFTHTSKKQFVCENVSKLFFCSPDNIDYFFHYNSYFDSIKIRALFIDISLINKIIEGDISVVLGLAKLKEYCLLKNISLSAFTDTVTPISLPLSLFLSEYPLPVKEISSHIGTPPYLKESCISEFIETILSEDILFTPSDLISAGGIKQPAYYAYELISGLSGVIITKKIGYLVVKRQNCFSLLFYNHDKDNMLHTNIIFSNMAKSYLAINYHHIHTAQYFSLTSSLKGALFETCSLSKYINDATAPLVSLTKLQIEENLSFHVQVSSQSAVLLELKPLKI